jgi:hypothetical protein
MYFISPQGEYPRFIGDIQLKHKGFKTNDTLPNGWVKVSELERPETTTDELAYEEFPVEVDGTMTQNWVIRHLTSQEIERRDAPLTVRAKLIKLGLTEIEVEALATGLVR